MEIFPKKWDEMDGLAVVGFAFSLSLMLFFSLMVFARVHTKPIKLISSAYSFRKDKSEKVWTPSISTFCIYACTDKRTEIW